MHVILNGFSLSDPRFLQYLTVNLKVWAYCSESLRKRLRSLQNAPKRSARGLPDPCWEPLGVPWGAKLVPKNVQEAHKASKRTGKWFPWDRQSVPKAPQDVLEGSQVVPKGPQEVPKDPQEVPKRSPRPPGGLQEAPKTPQEVPKRLRLVLNRGSGPLRQAANGQAPSFPDLLACEIL